MKNICPTCKHSYVGLQRFCEDCGIELVKEPNACSANKTALCREQHLRETAKFCPYCGEKTTYAIAIMDGDW